MRGRGQGQDVEWAIGWVSDGVSGRLGKELIAIGHALSVQAVMHEHLLDGRMNRGRGGGDVEGVGTLSG